MEKLRKILLDILFPKFCLCCNREGDYLCKDCKALFDIFQYRYCLCRIPKKILENGKCQKCKFKKLDGLYFPLYYQNLLIKKLIQKFKYEPFIRELAKPLASLVVAHLQLFDNKLNFSDFVLIPIPLSKRRLRWRGFNQAEELAKELSKYLKIPLISNCLIKTRETLPQVELSEKERKENIKEAFYLRDQNKISGKKILLIDDVYTTGSTMEEAARVLKKAGAKEVWGIVVARE
jgi:ComF family protein